MKQNNSLIMPNFLIIGAAKAGTTALCNYLQQHPQVSMNPVKETCFFAFDNKKPNFCGPGDEELNHRIISDITIYSEQFEGITETNAIGEASVWYLYSSKAPKRIKQYIPFVKMIVILRNPIERAYSSYLMTIREGREITNNFATAIAEEETRIRNGWEYIWHYKKAGFYFEQLKRYFDIFDQRQLGVYLYEDFCNNPIDVLQSIFQFLDVDKNFIPDISPRINISGIPNNKAFHDFLRRPNLIKDVLRNFIPVRMRKRARTYFNVRNLKKPILSTDVRKKLIEMYRMDILNLQGLIKRDLSGWLE